MIRPEPDPVVPISLLPRPDRPSILGRWVHAIRAHVRATAQRRRDMLDYQELEKAEDHVLKDIGVTRADIAAAKKRLVSEE